MSDDVDTQRDYERILELQIQEGLSVHGRPALGQFLSAVACGLNLGIGVFALFTMATQAGPLFSSVSTHILMAVTYTFGFVFTIMARTELFTEHTTLAVLPVLAGKASARSLGRLWTFVYVGNFVGGSLFALLMVPSGPALELIDPSAFRDTAMLFIDLSPFGVFSGAVLAGWLMALLSWILTSVGDTISRVLVIVITTFVIGFGHLPHCVAGNIEVLSGMLAGAPISVTAWLGFLAVTTVGNVVGGVVFVALLNYSHIVYGTEGGTNVVDTD
ncbi:MAG: formate/nitrite transporter family protein [Halobacteriales archaeon]|nr:formate/nitrite transporter family protein [Halobacteriales archaeon]